MIDEKSKKILICILVISILMLLYPAPFTLLVFNLAISDTVGVVLILLPFVVNLCLLLITVINLTKNFKNKMKSHLIEKVNFFVILLGFLVNYFLTYGILE